MSDPIAAAEAAGKARDIANRFETAVFLIAYGIAEKDGLYEADPHRYPYSQAFRHGMNILAALCAECSDDAEELLPTFNESDFIRNSAASDVREWTARWRDECREAVEGCRSIEIGPLASVDGDYFAATSECYEVLRFAENDLLGGHQERRVYEFLRAGTQEQYVYGRRMLIRHPLLTWNEYVRIKTGLALGDPDPLDQGEADTIDPVWLQEFVSMAYEPVPGAAKVCPNCGWTMTMRGKQPHCSSATCAKAVTGDFDKLDSVAHDAFRLSRGVMHYISSPGKLELAIAEAAAGLGLKYEMWPLKDTCDILIHLPDGRQLAVDAKAYGRAERLAREIEDDAGIAQMCDEDADKLINPYRFEIAKKSLDGGDAALNKLSQAVATSCEGIDDDTHSYSLNEYLAACGCSELPDELRTRFSFALKVIRFDSYLRELASAQDLLSFKDDSVDELYNFLKFSYTRQQHYLPNSLIGNIFGMKLDGNDLRLFRQFAFGRAFMCSLPWLDTDPAGAALGPHVLLLSGSSWEPGCLQYHVNRPVDYLLEAEPWKAAKLSTSTVRDLGIEQNVSGSAAEMRSGNLGIVLSQTMATLRDELDADGAGKALVIVNSYREAEDARDRIEQEFRRKGQAIKVAALVRNNHDHREHFVPRSEVYKFCDHPAKVLVAPAMAIERGFNIVDRGGHAVFTSLVFSVRPMGTPHDLGGRYRKLNGLIEREVGDYPANPGEFATEVRASAWRTWKTMERDENLPMGAWRTMGRQFLVDDAISTLMVTIIQIFGRLARLADKERPAPHVYFADAAFRGGDGKLSFRTLEELGAYMERLMHDSDQPEVAKALYGPFYESFRKGIGNVGL